MIANKEPIIHNNSIATWGNITLEIYGLEIKDIL